MALLCAGLAVAVAAGSAIPAGAAGAAPGNAIINDCEANGVLTHQYSVAQLRQALSGMSATTKEYTDCFDVIQGALAKARRSGGTGSTGGSSGGSFLPTPVIVILVILILAALTLGAIALRRRSGSPDDPA